ncbi:MAG: M48 family metalloprotease [Bacteroidetes bacterium]|nr:M48 family metalloprotease [Bacteroidota bacterium]
MPYYSCMLLPLPYHQKVKDHFKLQSKTWEYFAIPKNKETQLEEFKTELLKNTYKFDPVADAPIYEKVKIALERMDMPNLPVTVFQAQHTDELNASIAYTGTEASIVFSGPILRLMEEDELLAILAHELSHIKLYSLLNGELEVADRIISAIANNYHSEACYYETARLFRLYTEIFCDRGAFTVLQKTDPVISSLIKVSTGLDKVNASSYLNQADEIFEKEGSLKTAGFSHPENFIRAKAIQLWQEKGSEAETDIIRMIEGVPNLDQLDIFQQMELSRLTKQLLSLLLKPKWMQSTLLLSQATQFFPDFVPDPSALLSETIITQTGNAHTSIKEYIGYLLLDFALADPALENIPAGWTLQFAEDIRIKDEYDAIVKKEMKLSEKKLQQYKQKSLAAYYEVKENESEQIYE